MQKLFPKILTMGKSKELTYDVEESLRIHIQTVNQLTEKCHEQLSALCRSSLLSWITKKLSAVPNIGLCFIALSVAVTLILVIRNENKNTLQSFTLQVQYENKFPDEKPWWILYLFARCEARRYHFPQGFDTSP